MDTQADGSAVDDALPTTTTVSSVVELTLDQRVGNIERVLRDYIANPPKLADALVLQKNIDAVKGQAESALRQIADISDTHPQRIAQVESRMGTLEQAVQQASTNGGPIQVKPSKRDLAHENAYQRREWRCARCGSGTTDIVRTAETNSNQRGCPSCGGTMEVVDRVPVNSDGSELLA